jgi:hypothetical protein
MNPFIGLVNGVALSIPLWGLLYAAWRLVS